MQKKVWSFWSPKLIVLSPYVQTVLIPPWLLLDSPVLTKILQYSALLREFPQISEILCEENDTSGDIGIFRG